MTKNKIYWLCQFFGWGIYGLLQIIAYTVANGLNNDQIIGVLFQVAFYITTTHLLRAVFIRFGWLNLRLNQLIPKLFVLNLFLSFLNYGYLLIIQYLSNGISNADLQFVTIFLNTLIYWAVYFLWTIFYFAFHYVDRYNKSLRAKTAAREVELSNLKAQLNPHFIFNALNSIRALVDEDPRKSKESITQLSHILRNSLISDRKKLVPFSEELKTAMDYLALESIRYEERLITKFDIDRNSGRFMVPPLMLQTLVENGIKHGISNLKEGGEISISTKVKSKHLLLKIRNSGQLSKFYDEGKGLGIENTKKRLNLIFGEAASFNIHNETTKKTVLCTLNIPTYDGKKFT
ncbi:MAG: histidine kinase [Bacteroidota bacterium]